MAVTRYSKTQVVTQNGKRVRTASSVGRNIRFAVQNGIISTDTFVLSESQRLDVVAANYYGSAEYWWIIAAASGIGWQCQVPPGTVLKVPTSLEQVGMLL